MDIRKVKKLIELLEESNIDEIEIKEGEESVRISRNGAAAAAPQFAQPGYYMPQPAPQPRPPAHPAVPDRYRPRQRKHRNHGGQGPQASVAHGRHLLSLPVTLLAGLCRGRHRR